MREQIAKRIFDFDGGIPAKWDDITDNGKLAFRQLADEILALMPKDVRSAVRDVTQKQLEIIAAEANMEHKRFFFPAEARTILRLFAEITDPNFNKENLTPPDRITRKEALEISKKMADRAEAERYEDPAQEAVELSGYEKELRDRAIQWLRSFRSDGYKHVGWIIAQLEAAGVIPKPKVKREWKARLFWDSNECRFAVIDAEIPTCPGHFQFIREISGEVEILSSEVEI